MQDGKTIVGVTGGTGCIGRALVRQLLELGYAVRVLTRRKLSGVMLQEDVTYVGGGLNSEEALRMLTSGCDVIFHLAGKVHVTPRSRLDEVDFFRVNVDGTELLLRAAGDASVRRVVFFSTVGVYGRDGDFHGDETSPCAPRTAYARSKLEAERLVLQWSGEGVVLRLPVVYGPGDRGNMARLIRAVRYRAFVHLGGGNAKRSVISSANAASVAIKAAFKPRAASEVFCVTDGYDPTLHEMMKVMGQALGFNRSPFCFPMGLALWLGRCGDLLEWVCRRPLPLNSDKIKKLSSPLTFSNKKAEVILGYRPVERLDAGIRREVQWLFFRSIDGVSN